MLPHVGVSDFCETKKAYFLGYMVHRLLLAALGRRELDDRDHYGNKRLDLAGPLMALLFRGSVVQLSLVFSPYSPASLILGVRLAMLLPHLLSLLLVRTLPRLGAVFFSMFSHLVSFQAPSFPPPSLTPPSHSLFTCLNHCSFLSYYSLHLFQTTSPSDFLTAYLVLPPHSSHTFRIVSTPVSARVSGPYNTTDLMHVSYTPPCLCSLSLFYLPISLPSLQVFLAAATLASASQSNTSLKIAILMYFCFPLQSLQSLHFHYSLIFFNLDTENSVVPLNVLVLNAICCTAFAPTPLLSHNIHKFIFLPYSHHYFCFFPSSLSLLLFPLLVSISKTLHFLL